MTGVLEVPFMNGIVTFDELIIPDRHLQIRLKFDLCYAGNADLSTLQFESVFSNSFDVINVNECFEEIDACSVNANCTDTDGSYDCECVDGNFSLFWPYVCIFQIFNKKHSTFNAKFYPVFVGVNRKSLNQLIYLIF